MSKPKCIWIGSGSERTQVTPAYPPKRKLPKDFTKAVKMLSRPYTVITESEFNDIMWLTKSPATDFIIHNGKLCTFGSADRRWAIMPIDPEHTPPGY